MTLEELHCSEFIDALRSILAPEVRNRGSYGRAELNLGQERPLKSLF